MAYGQNYNRDYPASNGYQKRGNYLKQTKKKSGAKFLMDKKGVPCITGWNASKKRGMIGLIASPKKTGKGAGKTYTSPTSKRKFELWTCKLTFKDTFREEFTTGMYYPDTRKLILKDFGMVANPSAPNKGYFGTNRR